MQKRKVNGLKFNFKRIPKKKKNVLADSFGMEFLLRINPELKKKFK